MKRALFIILSLSLFIILMQKVYEPDVFWHIKTGEIILKTKQIPEKDIFSYITEGKDWTPPEWLAEIFFYIAYKIGGFVVLNLFAIFIYTATFILLFLTLVKRKLNPLIAAFLVTIAALASSERSQPRPHIFTYFFFVLMISIIDEYRLNNKKYIYFLPLIFLIWANFHPESGLAVFLFFIILLIEICKFYINKNLPEKYSFLRLENEQSREKLIVMSIIIILSFVTNFLNPQGYKIYDFFARHPEVIKKMEINEFLPLDYSMFPKTYLSIIVFTILGIIGIKRNFHELPLVITFAILTIKIRRFLPEFYIVAVPAAASSLVFLWDNFKILLRKKKFKTYYLYLNLFLLGAYIVFSIEAIKWQFYYDFYNFKGIGLIEKYFPQNAFKFIRENNIKPRVYNTANLGGGIILNFFPELKTFEDTRLISYESIIRYKESYFRPDFLQLANWYDVNFLILDTDLNILTNNPDLRKEWALVYFDDFTELFVRKVPQNEYIYRDREFLSINPERIEDMVEKALDESIIPLNILYELRRAKKLVDNSYKIHYALGAILSLNLTNPDAMTEAEKELKKSVEILPLYPYSNKMLASVYTSYGDYEKAIKHFERLVRVAEYNKWESLPDILNEFGVLYLKAGKIKEAKKCFKKAIKIDPKISSAQENLKSIEKY